MKVFKHIVLFSLLLIPTLGFSQKWKLSRSEYTYGVGISNYFGDIGGSSKADALGIADLDLAYSRPVLAVGYRYRLYASIAVKANLSYANIYGSDVKSIYEGRKYSFTTNMFELNGQVEYHIIKEKQMVSYKIMSMRNKVQKFNIGINLYVFAGVGGAYFKPKAKDSFAGDARFVDNKNLTFAFPVGFGLRYPLSSTTNIGLELGGRFTTTDFIDGFSPEASNSNDIYYFTVINVSTKIKRKKRRSR
jgi:opacity protein-like surface antigen